MRRRDRNYVKDRILLWSRRNNGTKRNALAIVNALCAVKVYFALRLIIAVGYFTLVFDFSERNRARG